MKNKTDIYTYEDAYGYRLNDAEYIRVLHKRIHELEWELAEERKRSYEHLDLALKGVAVSDKLKMDFIMMLPDKKSG